MPSSQPRLPPIDHTFDPVSVELDFMEPFRTGRNLVHQRGKLRLDERGAAHHRWKVSILHNAAALGATDPVGRAFLALKMKA